MPRPSTRGSRHTVKRVRFATTATLYGEDSAPASAPVRGGPRLTVRPRRSGSSSSSSSKSAPTTSNATRSSSRSARLTRSAVANIPAACPRASSVSSSTSSTSSRPFRSVSFARAAARSRSPSPCSAPAPLPSPVESSAGAAVDACASSVCSRSASPPAASVRSHPSAAPYRITPWTDELVKPSFRPSSPIPDSRPLLTDSETRRMDELQFGIRRLREETHRIRDDHHRMVRPAPRPRRPTAASALAVPRPRNPTPATARPRSLIKAPDASASIRVPRTRALPTRIPTPTETSALALPRSREPIKPPAQASTLHVPRTRPHTQATAQAESRPRRATGSSALAVPRPRNPTPPSTRDPTPIQATRPASRSVKGVDSTFSVSARRAVKKIDDLLAKFPSSKPKSILKAGGSTGKSRRTRPAHVSFDDRVETSIVDRWIERRHVHPAPPRIAGALQGWKTDPLPEPTDDGEDMHFTTYWCSVQCSQITHSHYDRPCQRQCAWNRLARIAKSKARQICTADDDLAYHSTEAVFNTFNSERESLRNRGVDLL